MLPIVPSAVTAILRGAEAARFAADVQSVVFLRCLGMAGLWSLAEDERARMVSEKPPAFAESWAGFCAALVRGAPAEDAYDAWSGPLCREVRANRERLGSLGPRLLNGN